MNKFFAVCLLGFLLLLPGWDWRPAYNRPVSVVVDASSTNVPTAFSNASGSLVLQDLTGSGYQHISVANETNSPISILTLPEVSASPGSHVTGQRLHISSLGAHAFDDVSVFDNLYVQSEDNTIVAGKIRINVW